MAKLIKNKKKKNDDDDIFKDKKLGKEVIIGIIEAVVWCSIVFLLIYGYSDTIIDIIRFMADNNDKALCFYLTLLPIFIIVAIIIKAGKYIFTSTKK